VSETEISLNIRRALKLAGFWCERVNSGKVPTRGGFFQGASKGTPDTVVVSPVYGWLETKTPEGKLSDGQRKWHAKAKARCVRIAVVMSASEAIAVVRGWRREAT
jgi:hypothetical protein